MGSNQNLILVPGLICDDEVWAHAEANLSETPIAEPCPPTRLTPCRGWHPLS